MVTLDGPMRNTWALIAAGVPDSSIVVMEMRAATALYHRLMKMGMGWGIHTIWTGEDQHKASNGFQPYLYHSRGLRKPGSTQVDCISLCRFCGDIPRNMRMCLYHLPNLRILGLTQGKRNSRAMLHSLMMWPWLGPKGGIR